MQATNYNALTDTDLREQLEWLGYFLVYNENDELELLGFERGYQTREVFDSVAEAHRYVFTL